MALIRWRPRTEVDPFLRGFRDLQEEINRMFNYTLSGGWPSYRNDMAEGAWAPAINVLEEKDDIVVSADLPGMSEKDIDVTIVGDTLTIKGEKKHEEKKDDGNYHMFERVFGAFQRAITLPALVESDKAKASFKNGVLEIRVPKKEEAKPKQLKVNIG
ncbi:MAG: Hsp20/alpha crystallin family protein [Candidatus Abyssobacteria bacterium SURF_5]|uniref:Hsp20/alpha crystallin family protein n=1 Tax=Abyssobacteria bacterium (strain SURF_5) TaxID=2093360 RepID=A0A3A4P4R3_ABYX5|nr:MAG: Hsp20/alpha crystallin family protein [Candidatus Abyssubacteria bacterium SURF_5]